MLHQLLQLEIGASREEDNKIHPIPIPKLFDNVLVVTVVDLIGTEIECIIKVTVQNEENLLLSLDILTE